MAARQPRNAVGWILMAIAYSFTLQLFGEAYVETVSRPGYPAVAWAAGWLFNVWLLLVVSFLPLVFPDGHLLSRRWVPAWWVGVLAMLSGIIVAALSPGELGVSVPVDNPIGVHGTALSVVQAMGQVNTYLLLTTVVLSGASLVVRWRRSSGRERLQVKWFAFAGLTTIGGLLVAALGQVLHSSWGELVGGAGWTIFLSFALLGIPVATGVAILRHHLYDIDVVINRTLVYGTLTAALAATYVGSVLLLRLVLSPVAGDSALAVAGSTLAVAALFRPARARIQAVVDRRFYRSRYDAARTLDEFAQRLRHELDLDAVGADLCTAADRTVQPSHISLWLRP